MALRENPAYGEKTARRRRPKRPKALPAERTQRLLECHAGYLEEVKAEAAAKGTPNDWNVDTSWADDLDAPISMTSVGRVDPKTTEEALEALAEFLVDVWVERQRGGPACPREAAGEQK